MTHKDPVAQFTDPAAVFDAEYDRSQVESTTILPGLLESRGYVVVVFPVLLPLGQTIVSMRSLLGSLTVATEIVAATDYADLVEQYRRAGVRPPPDKPGLHYFRVKAVETQTAVD